MKIDMRAMAMVLTALVAGGCLALRGQRTLDTPRWRTVECLPTPDHARLSEGSVCEMPDGSCLFAYTLYGKGHGDNDCAEIVTRRSLDGGLTWTATDAVAVTNHAKANVMSVSLLPLGDDRVALFYIAKDSGTVAWPTMRVSSDSGRTWGESVCCVPRDKPAYYVLNNDRAVRLASGRILLPLANMCPNGRDFDWCAVGQSAYSDDEGRTWKLGEKSEHHPRDTNGKAVRQLQETGAVELAPGNLLMYARTDHGEQWFTVSKDDGVTWGKWWASSLSSPLSPAKIVKLSNGDLCAVWNNMELYPHQRGKGAAWMCGARSPLVAAISRDGGRTWPIRRTLEGDFAGYFTYPSAREIDGNLLLSYSCRYGLRGICTSVVPVSWLYGEGPGNVSPSEEFLGKATMAYGRSEYRACTNTVVVPYLTCTTGDVPVAEGRIGWVKVEGVRNVRDIGGWTGLRPGRAYRGTQGDSKPLQRGLSVTANGLKVFREKMKIKTDLDLRGVKEMPTPGKSPFGCAWVHAPVQAYMGAFETTNEYAKALRVFADEKNYPIYFHCWGGADRTGTLAFILEGLCGADEAILSADYELTSFAGFPRSRSGEGTDDARYPVMLARFRSYPGATLAEKIAAYMKTTLGLTDAEIAAIRRNLASESASRAERDVRSDRRHPSGRGLRAARPADGTRGRTPAARHRVRFYFVEKQLSPWTRLSQSRHKWMISSSLTRLGQTRPRVSRTDQRNKIAPARHRPLPFSFRRGWKNVV